MNMVKPIDLAIVGAQKAGTTSLKYYLGEHPEICSHERIEFRFFVDETEYNQGYKNIFKKYFSHYNGEPRLVVKNVELMYNPQALKRLKEHNPDVKLVLILRHPVDRAYSAWLYELRKGREKVKSFEEAICLNDLFSDKNLSEKINYINRSLYYKHLNNIFELFPKEQVKVFLFEEFKKNPLSISKMIFEWLNVDVGFIPRVEIYNKSAKPRSLLITKLILTDNPFKRAIKAILPQYITFKLGKLILKINEKKFVPPPMNPETRKRLVSFFEPYNKQLSSLLQIDLSSWSQ